MCGVCVCSFLKLLKFGKNLCELTVLVFPNTNDYGAMQKKKKHRCCTVSARVQIVASLAMLTKGKRV